MGGFDDYALADGPTAGPTGLVSWATHLPTGRAVAVTELAEGARADEAFLARVRLTAAALAGAGAGSPHLLPIREVVEGAGRVWVVEDWVDGRELGEVLADGPLTPEQSVAVACGVLRGLAVAQAHGVVHGAVSPSTVVVTAGGVAQLVGFGFAGLPGLPGVDHARDVLAVATVLGDLLARATSQTRHPKLDEVLGRAMSDKARRGPPPAADLLAALEKAARADFGRKWEARTSLAPLALARSAAGQPSDPEPPTSSADATRELPPDVTHAVPGEEAATAPVLPAPDPTPVAPALPVPAAPDPPAAVRRVWGGGAAPAPAPAASPATAGDGKGRGRRTRRIQHRVMVRNLAGVILLLLGAGGALAVERVHGSGTRVSAADGPHSPPTTERPTAAEIASSDVTGAWGMKLVVVESTGFFGTKVGNSVDKTYTITSDCAVPPCGLKLAVSGQTGSYALHRDGDDYVLSESGPNDCVDLPTGVVRVPNGGVASVQVHLRPTGATRTPRGDWAASGLTGFVVTTFDTTNPACVQGSGRQRSTVEGIRQ